MTRQYQPPDYGRLVSTPESSSVVWLDRSVGVVFKVWSADTGNALSIVEQRIKPEALGGPVHVHYAEDEISYVLDGEVMVQLGEQVFKAGEGTLVFKPKGIPHALWNPTKRTARILQVFTPGGFEEYLKEVSRGGLDAAQLEELAERYHLEVQPETAGALVQRHRLRSPGKVLVA